MNERLMDMLVLLISSLCLVSDRVWSWPQTADGQRVARKWKVAEEGIDGFSHPYIVHDGLVIHA